MVEGEAGDRQGTIRNTLGDLATFGKEDPQRRFGAPARVPRGTGCMGNGCEGRLIQVAAR